MKSNNFFTILFISISFYSAAQSDSMSILKQQGLLSGNEILINKTNAITPVVSVLNPKTKALTGCQCWIERDTTWSTGQFNGSGGSGGPGTSPDYRNDDWTTPLINLPFTFCFYGSNQTSFYLNNNGNISFGAPYSTFTATGFPSTLYEMVAPFWGDVDTRNLSSGLVYYKITPTALIVQWDSVGYYDTYADKVNTFQLIITNSADPLIPNGNNVSFCYKDMQWTTGDASGGSGGFGGTPATVGANKGDGVNYIQFGTFDQASGAYDGPNGLADGIDWLDNKSLFFNTCSSSNIAPIANGMGYCDTMKVCVGETLNFNILFMSPEIGQTTTVNTTTTLNGYIVLSNTPANNVNYSGQLIGLAADVGFNTITFNAWDDGVPAQTTSTNVVIEVLAAPYASVGNDTTNCSGPVQLNASGGPIYNWSPSSGLNNPNISNPIANPATTTTYIVEVSNGVCSDFDTITVFSSAIVTISPNQTICEGDSLNLFSSGGISYSWNPTTGLSNATIANPVAHPIATTTYTVNITDINGCTGTASVSVTVDPILTSPFSYSPTPPYYINALLSFTGSSALPNNWYFGDGEISTLQSPEHIYPMPGNYIVCHELITTDGCVEKNCTTIEILPNEIQIPNVITPNGDGQNELLVFQKLEYYPNSKIEIYNRWGIKLYQNNNYLNNWDGSKYADGVYYYILGLNKNNNYTSIPGFFQLLKDK
ncbi:MAG: hypothetical protein A3F72_08175 [Bacteroidetes bacterium RIFCSPLOWO2_12_FULL_35_15]|nr:MAG: hypothetical protein A3F72_08175 [Bacteroidetes bacterium RIFCSPLOWO2_12_FULL_35_15]